MIKRINKIKKLGIFDDYKWDTSSMVDFKKFNVVYGWNGCGKTTLTKLFYTLSTQENLDHPDSEFEVEDENGQKYKQGETFSNKIRIFNEDYINRNIKLIEGKAEAIFILGEENKELAERIERDEGLVNTIYIKLKECRATLEKKQKERGNKFTAIASTISIGTKGLLSRNYRKPEAEKAFSRMSEKGELSEKELNNHLITVGQEIKPEVTKVNLPKGINETTSLQEEITAIQNEIQNLFSKTVDAVILERLKNNSDIAVWVETGIHLHKEHDSKECEFCGNTISEERLKQLTSHFNDADQKLKGEIDNLLDKLRRLYTKLQNTTISDTANLYLELQDEYTKQSKNFEDSKKITLESITSVAKELESKKSKTTESIQPEESIDIIPLENSVALLNAQIDAHNKKTSAFDTEKSTSKELIEKHFLSTIFDEVVAIDKEIDDCQKLQARLVNGESGVQESLQEIKDRITENRKQITSAHKACDEINNCLETFLGRSELTFKVDGEGYKIMRGDKPATMLSEGEKTAIAFIYFVIHLKDQNFKPGEGIIIIDDPISSLDSNSLFQAFSFLKNAVTDSMQTFILTHNFEFLRLLLNWLHYYQKDRCCYMIKNQYVNEQRQATLAPLDKLLQNYESEYQYLFQQIYNFKSDGSIESVYQVPNLARKVLDTFLMFRVPNSLPTFQKLEKINFDSNKKTAIYKFTNDQSHVTGKGFDPSLVEETQKNVKSLLEMIEAVFPEHYNVLVEAINS